MKLTEEQVQRVLAAHEEGRLLAFGSWNLEEFQRGRGCLVEIAFGVRNELTGQIPGVDPEEMRKAMVWFDDMYQASMDVGELRQRIADQGLLA